MNIIIAGGTGFVGQAVVKYCLDRGDSVTIISRSNDKVQKLFGLTVDFISWNTDDAEMKKQLESADAFLNLAGANISTKRWSQVFKQQLLNSRLDSAAKICHWFSLCDQKPLLLIASALSAYGIYPNISDIYQETDDTCDNSFLSHIALSLEQAYQPLLDTHCNVSFLRFSLVMHHSGGVLQKLITPTKLGFASIIGTGQQAWPWVSRHDLVCAILHIIEHNAPHQIYNCVNENTMTQADFSRDLAKALSRPFWLKVPALIPRIMFGKQMANELILSGTASQPDNLRQLGFKFVGTQIQDTLQS